MAEDDTTEHMTLTMTHTETGNDVHMMEEDKDLTPTVMYDKPYIQEQIDIGNTQQQHTLSGNEVGEPAVNSATRQQCRRARTSMDRTMTGRASVSANGLRKRQSAEKLSTF